MIYAQLARDYIGQGDWALAHIKLNDLRAIQPTPAVYYSLSAYLAQKEGREDEVAGFYTAGLAQYPDNVALLNNEGVWLSRHGQAIKAMACFKHALRFALPQEAVHIRKNIAGI